MDRSSEEFKEYQRLYNQEYREANRERLAEYERKRAKSKKEEIAAYQKAWRAKNREKLQAYERARHKERAHRESERSKRKKKADPVWYILLSAKARAKKNGLEFNLERGDFEVPAVCPALGIPLFWGERTYMAKNHNAPSLDRLDPSKGYVKGNVRVISNRANFIKTNATAEELRLVAEYAAREIGSG